MDGQGNFWQTGAACLLVVTPPPPSVALILSPTL